MSNMYANLTMNTYRTVPTDLNIYKSPQAYKYIEYIKKE
jgi:hypothetical protein